MSRFICLLPLCAAVLIEAHIRFLSFRTSNSLDFMGIAVQLMMESLPILITHYFIFKPTIKKQTNSNKRNQVNALVHSASNAELVTWHKKLRPPLNQLLKPALWFTCLFLYPPILISMDIGEFSHFELFESILFSFQAWLFFIIASVLSMLNHFLSGKHKSNTDSILANLFSLNTIVIIGIVVWSIMMAGVFNGYKNPMASQPLNLVIDVMLIFSEFPTFIGYFWQFLILGFLVGFVYFVNRYFFIRQLLSKYGVLSFLASTLIFIVLLTPLLSWLALQLPLNEYKFTLIPSGDHNPFDMANYRFTFFLFAISTPIVLAFERQQQEVEVSRIKSMQTWTELKLLQQQINPHFLFNTLNNLYALTLTKSEQAPEMVMKLSNLLRYTVYDGQLALVELEKEVNYLKDFIALHEIRLSKAHTVETSWPDQQKQHVIAPLLLINIVENAFKYGVQSGGGDPAAAIKITLTLTGNSLLLVCENPILKEPKHHQKGVGLDNLKRRLSLLYPNQHSLSTSSVSDVWQTRLQIELKPVSEAKPKRTIAQSAGSKE
ncbi:sensor histidine kinase [Psychrosphaera aestuarii]|uniref:sensor histidine kinase n=1 Tax=Psychrosphaera aestuarii TaxID=1266052 RepID=UPI001B33BB59|nr:histidine kinase [Psychrosphaera aestuarii]